MITFSLGAVGVIIRVRIIKKDGSAEDISSATKKEIYLLAPSNLSKLYPAEFVTDGQDGYLQYITQNTEDLRERGVYSIRCYITMTGYSGLTGEVIDGFTVK
jgi:hypothetical protein